MLDPRAVASLPCAAAALLGVAALAPGCSSAHRTEPRPRFALTVRLDPWSGYADSGVVRRGRTAWLAAVTSTATSPNVVRVYRRTRRHWELQGVVRLPRMPAIRTGGYVAAVSVTRSGAPDFTVNTAGADTRWFAVVARVRGRWRAVRFEGNYGSPSEIDAAGVRHHLVEAETNGCGCAGGPETYTWYRFRDAAFVPASPPGAPAVCSPAALGRARPVMTWQPSVELELLGRLRRPVDVERVVCGYGWALASGRRDTVDVLALYEQAGRGWLRAAVGRPQTMGRAPNALAVPESVLRKLARRLGVPLGRTPHYADGWTYPTARDIRLTPLRERTKVSVSIDPGALYAADEAASHGARWFVTATESNYRNDGRVATVAVRIHRWRRKTWALETAFRFDRRTAVPETAPEARFLSAEFETEYTHAHAPDFTLGGLESPGWFAIVSRAGGRWHAVRFGHGAHAPRSVDGTAFADGTLRAFADRGRSDVWYRYERGRFVVDHRSPQQACDPAVLNFVTHRRDHFTRSACAYDWALARGTRRGKSIVAVFGTDGTSAWSLDEILTPGDLGRGYTDVPRPILRELLRRLG